MVEETYNPSTDNMEKKEEPMINPSTGLMNFTQPKKKIPKAPPVQSEKDWRADIKREAIELERQRIQAEKKIYAQEEGGEVPKTKKELEARGYTPSIMHEEEAIEATTKAKTKKISIPGFLGITKRKIEKRPLKDKLKVLRLQNMLDKKRLQNQIERLKLQKKVELLRKKGVLKQIIMAPPRVPQQIYPAFSTPEMQADIDSMYADLGHGDASLWGGENYYNENYYDEDYYGDEFNNSDPFLQLAIKVKTGVSPLLW